MRRELNFLSVATKHVTGAGPVSILTMCRFYVN